MKNLEKINTPVLKTICMELNLSSLKELANHLRMPKGTIYTWDKQGKILDYDRVIEGCPDFNPIFIITGRGEIYKNYSAPLGKINKPLPYLVFESVLRFLNIGSIEEFSASYDIKYSRIKTWERNGTITQKDKYLLIDTLPEINPEFLLTGKGLITLAPSMVNEDEVVYQRTKKPSIIETIMQTLGIHTLTALATKTGLPMNTLSTWSKLPQLPIPQRLIDALPEVNPDFIIHGVGKVLKAVPEMEILRGEIEDMKRIQEQSFRTMEEKNKQIASLQHLVDSQKEIIDFLKSQNDSAKEDV
jgi:hypothetical protein